MPDQNKPDVTNNPPGERSQASNDEQGGKLGPGEPSPGLKDKDAETSDSYGDTRESGDPASR
ncbi:MAG TPA: hypothetical protein VHL79_06790 [Ramlibacter sp.]|jgi:hypothetical protein|nr:hypothetical protein [Ramlibacter sp.]